MFRFSRSSLLKFDYTCFSLPAVLQPDTESMDEQPAVALAFCCVAIMNVKKAGGFIEFLFCWGVFLYVICVLSNNYIIK